MSITLITGCFLGDKINDTFLATIDFRLRFLQLYLTILITSWLLGLLLRRMFRIALLAHVLVTNLFWVVVMIFPSLFGNVFSMAIWALYPAEAILTILITIPLHTWMLGRGLEKWNPDQIQKVKPKRRDRLILTGLLVLSFFVVFGSVAVVVQIYTGLPWRDVILILRGKYS
jgi:hypothetical protein